MARMPLMGSQYADALHGCGTANGEGPTRRLTTILPAMTLAEAIATTPIHGVAGLTGDRPAFVTTRPRRAPHHTISDVGLIGGDRCRCRRRYRGRTYGMLSLDARPTRRRHRFEGLRPLLEMCLMASVCA